MIKRGVRYSLRVGSRAKGRTVELRFTDQTLQQHKPPFLELARLSAVSLRGPRPWGEGNPFLECNALRRHVTAHNPEVRASKISKLVLGCVRWADGFVYFLHDRCVFFGLHRVAVVLGSLVEVDSCAIIPCESGANVPYTVVICCLRSRTAPQLRYFNPNPDMTARA